MAIQSILSNLPSIIAKQEVTKSPTADFGNLLTDFIGDVNKAQMDASKSTQSFVNGDGIETTSLQLLMEIRNKTVDMYRELTRMSI
jgi:flagellar hook-basal body complex protein FliE